MAGATNRRRDAQILVAALIPLLLAPVSANSQASAWGGIYEAQVRLISPHADAVNLMYRMRESSGSWKIIDVYYGSISQLTTRRSDFAAPIASSGAAGLIAHLNALSDDLLR